MTLVEFIEETGDEACSQLWGVELRTVQSWRRRERTPRRRKASLIVSTSPVTWEGIYRPQEEAAA